MSRRAFTIVEVLVVMTIILVLAGLILATSSYVHNKGARSRTEAEIAAMSAALENYKADNGIYANSPDTNGLSPQTIDFNGYAKATLYLYEQLSAANPDGSSNSGAKSYFSFKPQMLQRNDMSQPVSPANQVTNLRDPFGNSYGYSTTEQAGNTNGYNPTFDLWSTGGVTSGTDQSKWIKNW
ncbi:MAG TPA: prepilin-type N-terminal cleavage/methylation domain-containing protein [Chthoniobacterales bacterium]|jgi:prepilin-type N-terminal cleavage/methylation domain-containing protein